MNIAIIGTGNVGGALATAFAKAGHTIFLGVRNNSDFKGTALLKNQNTLAYTVIEAVTKCEVIILATPATMTISICNSLGDTSGKVIIDTMNIVMGNGPEGYTNTTDAILANTQTRDVVKCFNTTGFNNMENPLYHGMAIDSFVAGDSKKAKEVAKKLSDQVGFAECHDVGGNDKFNAMEQFGLFWINLALLQGLGRDIGFKLLKR